MNQKINTIFIEFWIANEKSCMNWNPGSEYSTSELHDLKNMLKNLNNLEIERNYFKH